MSIVLINPPSAKASEPPGGIARITGALRRHGIKVRCIDMNLEGFMYLYGLEAEPKDRWGRRAFGRKAYNLSLLTGKHGYANMDRYKNAVLDINKVLSVVSSPLKASVSLANYKSDSLSPVNSRDLLYAAAHPEENIYYPYFKNRFEELNRDDRLVTVGFSLNYLNQALCTFAMIGFLKKAYPSVRIIAGGGLITSWMRKPDFPDSFHDLIDVMIAGEGEKPLLEMFGETYGGSAYLPDYSDFAGKAYLAPGLTLPFCTASGCYWKKCSFCPEPAENNPYVPIPHHMGTEQLNRLVEIYDPAMVHIVDNAVSPAFMRALGKSGFKTPWYAFTRVTRHLTDPAFCRALKESGCRMLKLGVESGDSNVLTAMNKGISLADISKSLEALDNAGIMTYVYLLFGTPSEEENAARKTMDFVAAHSRRIGFLNVALFNLPYFAKEWQHLETGEFYEGDLSLYKEFKHPLGWNRSNIRYFLEREFKKHPDIAPIINRDPPVFNSNHAAFFEIKECHKLKKHTAHIQAEGA